MKNIDLITIKTNKPAPSFRWRQFKKNKPAYISCFILVILLFIALFSPIIANQEPLYVSYKGHTFFPAFSWQKSYQITDAKTGVIERLQLDITDWKRLPCDHILFALIPYSPGKKDYDNTNYKSPFEQQDFMDVNHTIVAMPIHFRHWMGTNKTGEDVLAGIIHGTQISMTVGIFAMLIASVIGLFLGCIAGYFGDAGLSSTRGMFWMLIIGLFFGSYYSFQMRFYDLEDALATSLTSFCIQALVSIGIFAFILFIFYRLGKLMDKIPFLNRSVSIPADSVINKVIEVLSSLPNIILIITIAAITKRSLWNVAIIIGLTSWTMIARQIRSEILRIRELEYIAAARTMGFSSFRILFFHALPNALGPAMVYIAFGIAGAIIIESSLSFLNIGVPLDTVSWGRLLNEGREQFSAWWLVIFPGFFIFLTVTTFNLIGEGIQDAMNSKHRS